MLGDNEIKNPLPIRRSAAMFLIVVGLVSGLIGGVMGAMIVLPWYEQNVLSRENESKERIVLEETAITAVVEKVNPAVVSIVITKDLPTFEQFGPPFGDFFFNVPSPTGETERLQIGAGSGFIISADGLIVTNKHVVSDEAAEYTVVLKDGLKFTADVVAKDPFNDLAIVKITAGNLPALELANPESIKLGQRVIAIGNALGEFQNTVTTGIVSGIGRTVTAGDGIQSEKLSEVIQTDAAINPGNSGGPLLNLAGQVIGVNTAISQNAQLVGFAIPVDQVKKVIDDVEEFGRVRRPFLGVRYRVVTETLAAAAGLQNGWGAWIVRGQTPEELPVVPGSPADQAGLREGDIILELEGEKITSENFLPDILRRFNPGDRVSLRISREGGEIELSVALGEAQ